MFEFVSDTTQGIKAIRSGQRFETMHITKDLLEQVPFCLAVIEGFMKLFDRRENLLYAIVKFSQQQTLGLIHRKIKPFSIADCQLPIGGLPRRSITSKSTN